MEVLRNAGIMALASMLVCVLPLGLGVIYAIWPTEPRLALVRTSSLATVFSAICGTSLGFINTLRFMFEKEAAFSPVVAVGLAESLVTIFFGFGCLTVTWLCVTIGLWRRTAAQG